MMRYQRVSPDCFPLTNGSKKSYLRPSPSSNKDTNITKTSIARGLHGGSCTTTTSSLDGVPKGFRFRSTQEQQQQQQDPSPIRDVLLQWGQRKRSRNSRTEIRSTTTADDSLSSLGQGKMQSKKLLRRSVNLSMPPPPVFSSRSTNPRNGFVCPKESSSGLTPSRNLEDRSPSRNINGRMMSRSAGSKRSPPSPDQIEKRSSLRDHTHQNQRQNRYDQQQQQQQHQRVNRSESTAQAHPELETNNSNGEREKVEVKEWPRIYIALSRKEKEEDFLVMKGTKLPHRPRKRAKNIDKALLYCFPGMWLSELTKSRYEVREKKNVKKKRRGLKGMESLDTDSE